MIVIDNLPADFQPPEGPFEKVRIPMNAEDRRRVRRRVQAPDGEELALALPTGVKLWPGQILYTGPGKVYVVDAAPEEVLVIEPRNIREAAFAGHLVGNMHRDIDLEAGDIAILFDEAIENRLIRAGLQFRRETRPFHGAAPGEHAH